MRFWWQSPTWDFFGGEGCGTQWRSDPLVKEGKHYPDPKRLGETSLAKAHWIKRLFEGEVSMKSLKSLECQLTLPWKHQYISTILLGKQKWCFCCCFNAWSHHFELQSYFKPWTSFPPYLLPLSISPSHGWRAGSVPSKVSVRTQLWGLLPSTWGTIQSWL